VPPGDRRNPINRPRPSQLADSSKSPHFVLPFVAEVSSERPGWRPAHAPTLDAFAHLFNLQHPFAPMVLCHSVLMGLGLLSKATSRVTLWAWDQPQPNSGPP
jgi:hypothetical protein